MKLFLASSLSKVKIDLPLSFDKPVNALKFVCITTAVNPYAADARAWHTEEMQVLNSLGFVLDQYDIEGKTAADVALKLSDADVVYVTGGNTYYLLEHLQKCDFASALQTVLAAGALYIGCSAGAVAACPSINYIGAMNDPSKATLTNFSGLNLVPFHILVHTDHHKYGPIARAIAADKANSHLNLLSLRDNQSLLVTDNYVEFF
jgi:dipeptidase E